MTEPTNKTRQWVDLILGLTPGRAVLLVGFGVYALFLLAAFERRGEILTYVAGSPLLATLLGIGLFMLVGGLVVWALFTRIDERSDALMQALHSQLAELRQELERERAIGRARDVAFAEAQALERRCQERLAKLEAHYRKTSGFGELDGGQS